MRIVCFYDDDTYGLAGGILFVLLFFVWLWAVWRAFHADSLLDFLKNLLLAYIADKMIPLRRIIKCEIVDTEPASDP